MNKRNNDVKQALSSIEIPESLGERSRQGIAQAAMELSERRMTPVGRRRRLWLGYIAASLAVLVALGASVWNTEVMASIQKALQFVPGFGVVQHKEDGSRLVLKQPVHWEANGDQLQLTSLSIDDTMTLIMINGSGGGHWYADAVMLIQNGQRFLVKKSMAVATNRDWSASYWQKGGLALEAGEALLETEVRGKQIAIPIVLEEADAFASYEELGSTASVNGIAVTAVVSEAGEKTRVFLASRHSEQFRIDRYGEISPTGEQLSIRDDEGNRYMPEWIYGVGAPANDFYLSLPHEAGNSYTLTIPAISVQYLDTTTITLPIETRADINRSIEIAGFPVTITGTELTEKGSLRIYTDVHYDERALSSLVTFHVEGISHMAKINEETEAVEYIEFDVKPGRKAIKLKFDRPQVVKRGPWILQLQPDRFPVGADADEANSLQAP